jgi:hypothetical protein
MKRIILSDLTIFAHHNPIPTKDLPELNYRNPLIERGSSCRELEHPLLFREPKGNIVDCIHVEEFVIPEMRSMTYFVLLSNGKLWLGISQILLLGQGG